MTAWHNDPDLKADVLDRMRQHRADDEIVQGFYQRIDPTAASGYRGCLIGCTLPPLPDAAKPVEGWHVRVEDEYGIPQTVGYLLDRTFEGLPYGQHAEFAVAAIDAIPVGADLSLVSSHLMVDVLSDPDHGVLRHAGGEDVRAAIDTVVALYRRRVAGDEPSRNEWLRARRAAASADAAFASAAFADAAAAAAAAAFADAAAAAAAFASAAARLTHWRWVADRILHHLRNAHVSA